MLRKALKLGAAMIAAYFVLPLVGSVAWDQFIKPRMGENQIDPERASWELQPNAE